MTDRDLIARELHNVYGKGSMVEALADHLAEKIAEWEPRDPDYFGDHAEQKLRYVQNIIWMWYSGGGTAEIAARNVLRALERHPGDVGRDQENLQDFQD